MNKTQLNQYMKTVKREETFDISDHTYTVTLKPLDFYTCAAIADLVAENVVTDSGEYRPELTEVLLLFNVLKESANIKFTGFDADEMFAVSNSELGQAIGDRYQTIAWMRHLRNMVQDKIDGRRSIYASPDGLISRKISALVDQQIETPTPIER